MSLHSILLCSVCTLSFFLYVSASHIKDVPIRRCGRFLTKRIRETCVNEDGTFDCGPRIIWPKTEYDNEEEPTPSELGITDACCKCMCSPSYIHKVCCHNYRLLDRGETVYNGSRPTRSQLEACPEGMARKLIDGL